MENNIHVTVTNKGEEKSFDVPNDIGLSLMEFLKASEYEEIEGICGGIALCATCHVRVLEGSSVLGEISNDEAAILETLPKVSDNSRLSCQVKLNDTIKELRIEII